MTISGLGRRLPRAVAACGAGVLALAGIAVPASVIAAAPAQASGITISSTGLRPGSVRHVWLIILENKSYDATFTGLNQNSYLWNTLPGQGVLLKNYYGTGHSSMDNYLSMVSGQAPEEDTQEDCSVSNKLIGPNSDILDAGSLRTNPNYGQMNSPANASQPSGANAPLGDNGCTLPDRRPDAVQPVQRGGGDLEGVRPGSGRRADAGLDAVRAQYRAGPGGRGLRRPGDVGQ